MKRFKQIIYNGDTRSVTFFKRCAFLFGVLPSWSVCTYGDVCKYIADNFRVEQFGNSKQFVVKRRFFIFGYSYWGFSNAFDARYHSRSDAEKAVWNSVVKVKEVYL